jgi:hypothetical protein
MSTDYKTEYSSDKNINTLERGSYNDWGDLTPAKQVLAKQPEGHVYDIALAAAKGETKTEYNEAPAIAVGVETQINSFTVPVGKAMNLNRILASGDNIARVIIKRNGSPIAGSRTWWIKFDTNIPFDNLRLEAEDIVSVHVVNRGAEVADFESTIIGDLYNV